jgi:putative N6-adenine-specific DNA methylase
MAGTESPVQESDFGKCFSRQRLDNKMTPTPAQPVNEKALARRIKDHVIGSRHEFFAIVHPGFEETAGRELHALGIDAFKSPAIGGITFSAKLNDAYRVNLAAGTISRLLLRLARFKATEFSQFNAKMAAFPWELCLRDQTVVAFAVSASHSRLWHTDRLEGESLAAIQSRLAIYGRQVIPAPKKDGAGIGREQAIFVRLDNDRCQVSLDSSGELLYRRGYDKFSAEAPLRETLACAILKNAAIGQYNVLLDPFCGSGTFGLEAGLIFSGRPCNQNRHFAFEEWPSFKPTVFQFLKEQLAIELKKQIPAGTKSIYCSDSAQKAVRTTKRNLEVMGLGSLLEVSHSDFFKLPVPATDPAGVLLVMNPPYGTRLGTREDTVKLYRRIGAKIRSDFPGCGYAIIVPGLELEKVLSLPYDKKILFRNGGIAASLLIHYSKTVERGTGDRVQGIG